MNTRSAYSWKGFGRSWLQHVNTGSSVYDEDISDRSDIVYRDTFLETLDICCSRQDKNITGMLFNFIHLPVSHYSKSALPFRERFTRLPSLNTSVERRDPSATYVCSAGNLHQYHLLLPFSSSLIVGPRINVIRIPMRVVKGDWNGTISRNNLKRCASCRCLDGHVKEP